jgi:hypothetical protein
LVDAAVTPLALAQKLAEHYAHEYVTTEDNATWRTKCFVKAEAFREMAHALETGESIVTPPKAARRRAA